MIEAEKLAPEKTAGTKRRFKLAQALVGVVLLGVVVGLGLYLNSESFRQRVRGRIVAELERMTGGRVELQSFTWNLSKLRFEARGLTIHGLEAPGEEPYVHADRISIRLKIISLLARQVALREVILDRLAVHLIIAADGTTNQPTPKTAGAGGGISADQLFDLAVSRVEINGGTLLLNQERIPFDLAGERFSASMNYSRAEHGYEGVVAASLLAAHWRNSPPMNGDVNFHFLMRAAETQVKSLKISSGKSTAEAIGWVRDYSHPEVDLHYTAALDLPEFARQTNIPELRAGRADLKGHLNYQANRVFSEGQADARALTWSDPSVPVHASGVDVSSTFTLTPERFTLPRFSARIFGGSVQGDLQIANWKAVAKMPSPQKGILNLQLSRVQIGQVAAGVSSARLPLNKVDLAGNASGEIKTSWTGALKNAVSEITLDVDPPSAPAAREVPVTAHMHATYRGDIRTLDIGGLNLGTRAIHVNLVGALGSRSARGHLAVNASSLREVQPILDALYPGSRLPISVDGRATFNGTVFGDLNALSANGHVELENFETEIGSYVQGASATGSGPALPSRIHWDSLVSDVGYSPSGLSLQRGTLRRGKGQVGFSGTIGLSHGRFDEANSPLSLDLRFGNVPVEDVQALAGLHYPVTGMAGIDLHVTGTARDLRGGGNLQIAKLTVYGEPFQVFHSQLQLVGREVQFTNLVLSHNGAQMTGNFAYDVSSRGFRFDLTGTGIELASLQSLQAPRLAVEGKGSFHLTGSGAGTGTPAINGRLDVANFKLNHEPLGAMNAVIETRGGQLALRGRATFEDASLNLDGTVQMRTDYPAEMTLQFANLDFDPLLRAYFQGVVGGHSSIAGSADIHGPLRRPRDLSVTGTVSQLAADIGNVKVQNEGPIRLSLDREIVRAQQFHLVGQDTDFFVQGSLGVAGEHALDLHTRGRFNLKLAQGFNPNILAYGPVNFTVDIGGTIGRPLTSGRFELVDAGVSLVDLPNGLSHVNGTMVFAQDRIQIEKLSAHSGGGELNLGGFLAYRNGFFFDLTATGKDVRLRYPPGVSASADASLRYTGSAKSSQLSGDITVTRFGLNPRFDFGVLLSQSKSPLAMSSLNPFLDNLRLDIHVLSTPELRVETSLAKVSGDVDLRVRGSASRPAVLGRVNIAEGDISFNGTKYRLERGDVTFSNPLVIEPVVNIEMSARVQNYDITVGLHGSLTGAGLRLTYRSDPPLSNSDIISLLAFGRPRGQDVYNAATPGQPGQNTPDTSASNANAVLGQALDAAVSNRVERLFGASRVKIDPQFIGQQNNSSARVTVEQTINNNITLTYVTSLTQSTETVVQVEYAVDKNVSIVAVRDRNGVLGFDVHIRRRTK
jgi:translocation and assembly module TamB